jgi:hypothetical protein
MTCNPLNFGMTGRNFFWRFALGLAARRWRSCPIRRRARLSSGWIDSAGPRGDTDQHENDH